MLMVIFTTGFLTYSRKRIKEGRHVTWLGQNTLSIILGSAILYFFLTYMQSAFLAVYNKVILIIIIPYLISELSAVLYTYIVPNAIENPLVRLMLLIVTSVYLFLIFPVGPYRIIIFCLIALFCISKSKDIYDTIDEIHIIAYTKELFRAISNSSKNSITGLSYVFGNICKVFKHNKK